MGRRGVSQRSEDTELAFDTVKATNQDVYEHILESLNGYLDALRPDEVTVSADDEFVSVLSDIADCAESAVLRVANQASKSCEVADLGELAKKMWPAVVAAGRFSPTVGNVSQFVQAFTVSDELTEKLRLGCGT